MEITLRAPGTPIDALTLEAGLHPIGRAPEGGLRLLEDEADARVWIRLDRAGAWLGVADGVRGVHVNGRPVRRRALLRAGDSVHVDGVEIVLAGSAGPADPVTRAGLDGAPSNGAANNGAAPPAAGESDPRVVLRGVGGRHHGRSFTLGQARTVGSAGDADIRLDESDFAPHHARIAGEGGQVVLRAVPDDASVVVNGVPCRHAVLRAGDQVAFDGGQRFVVQAPLAGPPAEATLLPLEPDEPPGKAAPATARRLPLLLFAALLLAAGIWALLLL